MTKKTLPKLAAAEFEIMEELWSADELTVTEVMNRVNGKRSSTLKRGTVQVQLNRLKEKGWLTDRREGNKFYFAATASREKAATHIVEDVSDRFFNGSPLNMVKCLFQAKSMTPAEISELRALLKEQPEEPTR